MVRDVRMRLNTRLHRTDAFYTLNLDSLPQPTRRRRSEVAFLNLARDEAKSYELFERLPCTAWKEFGSDGAVQSLAAFDGETQRVFTIASPRSSTRLLTQGERTKTSPQGIA